MYSLSSFLSHHPTKIPDGHCHHRHLSVRTLWRPVGIQAAAILIGQARPCFALPGLALPCTPLPSPALPYGWARLGSAGIGWARLGSAGFARPWRPLLVRSRLARLCAALRLDSTGLGGVGCASTVSFQVLNDTSGLGQSSVTPAAAERALVRGSVGVSNGMGRPKPWLHERDYEAQLRQHIDSTEFGLML